MTIFMNYNLSFQFYYCGVKKMKKAAVVMAVFLLSVAWLGVPEVEAEVDFSQELYQELAQNKNKVPYIKTPGYKRIELDNRLVVYLVEDHQLPTIEVTGYINGGRSQETKEVAGISRFMLQMMSTGTQKMGEQKFDRYQELHGIDVNFSVSQDYYSLSANSLSTDQTELISLLADILRHPKFTADYYQRIKKELARSLEQATTQQDSLLNMYYYKNIYSHHPYSFASNLSLRKQALQNITPQRLQKFYNQNIAPNNIVLGIIGDFEAEQMEKLLQKEFADWKRQELEKKVPEVKENDKNQGKVVVVNKSDATQAKIRMGYNFFTNQFSERVAFKMANFVYGGGDFSSRLMENLRSERGYVYSIYSSVNHHQLGGTYYVETSVKPNKSLQAIKAVKKEMRAIKSGDQPIKEEELFEIVNLYNGLLPKSYKDKAQVVRNVMYNCEIRGRQPDYFNQFISQYNDLTAEQVQKSFKEFTYPEQFFTVIVGNKEDILPVFKEEGIKVNVVNPNQ